jgi:hypothetical protein
MDIKHCIEQFKQLHPVTQVVLVVFALTVVVLVVFFPAAGASIVTFLVALRTLTAHHQK